MFKSWKFIFFMLNGILIWKKQIKIDFACNHLSEINFEK